MGPLRATLWDVGPLRATLWVPCGLPTWGPDTFGHGICSGECVGYIRISTPPGFGFCCLLMHQLIDIQVACTLERDGE